MSEKLQSSLHNGKQNGQKGLLSNTSDKNYYPVTVSIKDGAS